MIKFSLDSLLGLFSIPGIGSTRMRNLISHFETPQNVLKAPIQKLCQVEGIDKKTAKKISEGPSKIFIDGQLKYLDNSKTTLLTFWDETYPDKLKRIFDPPAFLFVKGDLKLLETTCIGIVGSRTPTEYGRTQTRKIVRELVQSKITIVSGFARGVDFIAHQAALDDGGKTIAVLGNGLNVVYPSENKKLLPAFERDGLLISEYPFGTKPDAGNFPKRNRIISGLSEGVLVSEAALKSGALLTAMYALDQNREVFALPGPVNSSRSTGTNNLIKQGAKLVQDSDDILSEISGHFDISVRERKEIKLPELKATEKKVYDLVKNEPQHIDYIALNTGISTSETLTILLTLELLGVVRQMAGKMFTRI